MAGDVPAQEIARPHVQGAQGCNNHIACHPTTIAIAVPRPHIDKVAQHAGIVVVGKPLHLVGSHLFADENDAPNILALSPCKGDHPTKRRGKRKSPSRGLGGLVLHPPPLPLKHSITPPPMLQCKGIYTGFLGSTLTFAAKSMQHTANQLQQWAKVPNFGVNSFTCSLLLASRSICLPYQGVVLNRMCNLNEG
jgi:hypothetical protein